ncbi:MAG: PAS-domain containing protein [Ferrovibrio sp.]|uniref:PAS domain-containing sensor histidine kinase n=1 Tax=Ferrovibrio sp. TaxID=1917215 RepID=UPI002622EA7C|nr:PAS domain-containing sensor histidine kinase [Ferrovibrio sp.]MCW0236233.1 PAS-domain containing protein [Ferrovibrio sp.]
MNEVWWLTALAAAAAGLAGWQAWRARGLRETLRRAEAEVAATVIARDGERKAAAALQQRLDSLTAEVDHLRRAEAQASALLDAAPFPIWRRDGEGRLLWVNARYALMAETTTQDAIERGLELASAHDLDQPRDLALAARAAATLKSQERRFVAEGDRRNYRIFELPIGEGTLGFGQDITPEADARGQLRRHMEAHMEVLRTISTATAIYGPDKKLLIWNRAYARLWQLDEAWLETRPTFGEVLEQLRAERRLPEQIDWQSYKRSQLSLFTTVIERQEELIHLPDGSTLRLVISAYPSGGLLFAYDDVTRQLTLERATNTMIAVQRATLDNLYEAVVVYGSDGRLSLYNRAFAQLWQIDADMLNRQPHITEVMEAARPLMQRGPDWAQLRERLIDSFASRKGTRGRLERGDGTVIDYASVPLPDGAVLYTYLDVSANIRIERALRERNEALERTDRMNAAFISNITHDLRSPLGTLISMTEVLAQGILGPMNARQEEYCADIMITSRDLLRLLDDIIAIATIEVGQMALEPAELSLDTLWREDAALWRELADHRAILLDLPTRNGSGAIIGDSQRLRQALDSVMAVALDGTPQGGRVALSLSADDESHLGLRIECHSGGLSPVQPRQLFADLVDAPEQRRINADLSLVVARGLFDLHGARLKLDSANGAQAVDILLPRYPLPEPGPIAALLTRQ